jgi:uncharacterized protein (DUF952 family)
VRMTIYHIARLPDWQDALKIGEYRVSTAGLSLTQVGFIHASTADQVAPTAERFYKDEDGGLCVLVIDDAAVRRAGTEIVAEDVGGELFPHIYGPLRTAWVSEVRPAAFTSDGRFLW